MKIASLLKLSRLRFVLLAVVVAVLSLAVRGSARAQSWCAQPANAPQWGCLEVHISPSGVAGDFYVDTYPMAYYSYVATAVVLPGTRHIVVNNITSNEPGWNQFFVYPAEASTFATVNQGQLTVATVKFNRIYINGGLQVNCNIRSATENDDLACLVSIDGIQQPDILAPQAKATYYVPPGTHHVTTQVIGGSSSFWTPLTRDVNVAVRLGRVTVVSPRFDKMAHLTATTADPNTAADYYVDGILIASQAPSIDLWLLPGEYHKLEMKNINDLNEPYLYEWLDYTTWVYIVGGQTRNVAAAPLRIWHKGYLQVGCYISNYIPGYTMECDPSIDGVPQAPIQMNGTDTYILDKGPHTVTAVVGPPEFWVPQTHTYFVTVFGGKTTAFTMKMAAVSP